MTWLYGPLHEHVDSVPPPKIASTQDRLDLVDINHTKSILKHRTISEMLTTPGRSASPTVERNFEEEDEDEEARDARLRRGTIFAVRSDSNIQGKNNGGGGIRKRGSPPITPSEQLLSHPSLGNRTDSATSSVEQEKRHISFNQRVEQCISIDIDEHDYDDDEDDDEEDYDDDDEMNGNSSDEDNHKDENSSDDDDDEQILTMKASPRMSPSLPLTSTSSSLHSSRNSSPGPINSDHHTIAKLAPTLLKTTGNFPSPSPAVVDPSGIAENRSHSPSPQNSSPSATPGGSGSSQAPKVNSSTGGHVNPANMFDTPVQEDAPPNPQGNHRQWDDDEEFSSNNFDYFNGPDMGGDYELDHSNSNRKGGQQSSDSVGLESSSPEQGRSGWISPGSSSSGSSSNGGSHSTATSNPISTSTNATTSSTRDLDDFQSKNGGGATFSLGSPPSGNQTTGTGQTPSLPRSILKRRAGTTQEQNLFDSQNEDGDFDIHNGSGSKSGSFNNETATTSSSIAAGSSSDSLDCSGMGGGGDRERGRPAQRLGSSASYERLQEAASKSSGSVGGVGSSNVGIGNSRGRSGSSSSNGNSISPSHSPYGSYEQVSQASKGSHPPSSSKNSTGGSSRRKVSPQQQQRGQQVGSPPNPNQTSSPTQQQSGKFRPQERRDSFREGERPMGLGSSSSNSKDGQSEKKISGSLNDHHQNQNHDGGDEDGGAFDSSEEEIDANEGTHGPAGKDEVELRREQKAKNSSINKKGKSTIAATSKSSGISNSKTTSTSSRSSIDSNRSFESSSRDSLLPQSPLNIDTSNVPPNQNPSKESSQLLGDSPAIQLPGPTPLNTPTLALAKSRSNRKKVDGKNKAVSNGKATVLEEDDDGDSSVASGGSLPNSPTVPRRQTATGALVAPTHSGDLPRIPLADDYVDEDEGGIIGRAVEIVNTARDLIGALLGSGGAGGRSWREGGI